MESNYAATPRKKKIKYTFHPEEKIHRPRYGKKKRQSFYYGHKRNYRHRAARRRLMF